MGNWWSHKARVASAAVLSWFVIACGGGGSGAGTNIRTALPELVQDINPSGERLDYRSQNYFPMGSGDTWTYDLQRNGASTGTSTTRSIAAGSNGEVILTETFPDGSTESQAYRRTGDGVVAIAPLEDTVPAAVSQLVGNPLEYPEPFYAIGTTRRMVRQGDWGADVDGDGVSESFRFEMTQVLVGIGDLALPSGGLQNAAHFSNVVLLTLQPSNKQHEIITVTSKEEAWWAPGIGLVRAERSAENSAGAVIVPSYTLVLTSATVDGANPLALKPNGLVVKIALTHNALVFDRSRNLYYASIPGRVSGNGNRIATINPSSNTVTYAAQAIGSEPSALALAHDGSALYVGLNGSGEVAKLRLPDLTQQWRARLPTDSFFGQLLPERIAVSPTNADMAAVSMMQSGISPRHGGVALIRSGTVLPVVTQGHTGSNLIVFDGSGQYVYGFNNESTEFGLHRLKVLADGLREEQVTATLGADFGTRTLDWSANQVSVGRALYRTPELTLVGQVPVTTLGCRFAGTAPRLVCANGDDVENGALSVLDATSLTLLASPVYLRGTPSLPLSEIVPGAPGQVALRINTSEDPSATDNVWLFTSPMLH